MLAFVPFILLGDEKEVENLSYFTGKRGKPLSFSTGQSAMVNLVTRILSDERKAWLASKPAELFLRFVPKNGRSEAHSRRPFLFGTLKRFAT
jgi:hypothetical protein